MALAKSIGNMYPWVDFMHTHLGGECPHKCIYCYVDNPRFGRPARYTGPLRLIEDEFKVKYDKPGTYFIEHKNDLFAEDVPGSFIDRILSHCTDFSKNTYIFQTKNPKRYLNIDWSFWGMRGLKYILGCTIESNWIDPDILGIVPFPQERAAAMREVKARKFITVEPILKMYNINTLAYWIKECNPEFVNIGADSKRHNLPEPTGKEVLELINWIKAFGIEIRGKENLQRLLKSKE
jgi:DNA repair photolyase